MRHIPRSTNRALLTAVILLAAPWSLSRAAGLQQVVASSPRPSLDAASFAAAESGCGDSDFATGALLSDRTVEPSSILSCETAKVTVSLGTSCVAEPLHVVISLDRSGSMLSGSLEQARKGAWNLVQALNLKGNPNTLVGVVSHGSTPRIDMRLSNDEYRVRGAIRNVTSGSNVNDNLGGSVLEAHRMLLAADGADPRRVIVVFSDGETDGDPNKEQAAKAAARNARGNRIELFSICVDHAGSNCPLMREMASPGPYSFTARDRSLIGAFGRIAQEMRSTEVQSVTYTEVIPVGLEVISGTIRPAPHGSSDLDERRYSWRLGNPPGEDPTGPVTRTVEFQVRPTRPQAVLPVTFTLSHAEAFFQDNEGHQSSLGTIRVPTTTLQVRGACPDRITPTSPPPPPRPPSPKPPATPTPIPTAVPAAPVQPPPPSRVQPWPTAAGHYRIALPIAQLYRCPKRAEPPDTVLLLDVSTSMAGRLADGRRKSDGLRWAARQYLSEMLRGDRVALVTFGDDTRVSRAGLSPNEADLRRDLRADGLFRLRSGTRIDRALTAAMDLLEQGARPEQMRQPVIVLITDGRMHDDALAQATRRLAQRFDHGYLRGYGNTGRLFTVAVDGSVAESEEDRASRHDFLRDLASKPSYAYQVERADALAATAARIAAEQRCQEGSDRS